MSLFLTRITGMKLKRQFMGHCYLRRKSSNFLKKIGSLQLSIKGTESRKLHYYLVDSMCCRMCDCLNCGHIVELNSSKLSTGYTSTRMLQIAQLPSLNLSYLNILLFSICSCFESIQMLLDSLHRFKAATKQLCHSI